ncbi:MAG: protein kinase [Phycisphaerae bacterium]|jgi:WD40 repeat protein/serine/threonine protein kinase|nr:protein kinase [Phycisphaerae bacterium]
MTLDNNKARELFNAARNLPSAEREPFLDKECGEDDALRVEVEALLKHHDFTSANTEDSGDAGGFTVDYEPGDMIGKFKIIGVLGEGGMGIVYLAEQSKPVRRRVALKVIKAGMDTKQVIARFEAERQALAIMNHPGIAQVYEAGATEEGRPYFVLEFVKGMPITDACDEHKQNTEQRLELLAKVCDAVQHAHTKGIIHRDLKPSNILVSLGEDDILEPKIIDFGVAKATNQQLTDKTLVTQVGRFIGTPAYMSPEQADLKAIDIDTRTDIYALGVVTYEVLSGFPPFDPQILRDAGLEKMREIIRTQSPPKPSTQLSSMDDDDATKISEAHQIQISSLAGLLRKELEWIPLKALRKRRSERYDSAKSMGDDIRRYLKGDALEAVPESISYRFKKTVHRHKGPFIAGSIIVFVMFLGVLATSWQWRNAVTQKRSAQKAQIIAEDKTKEAKRAVIMADAEKEKSNTLNVELQNSQKALELSAEEAKDSAIEANSRAYIMKFSSALQEIESGNTELARKYFLAASDVIGEVTENLESKYIRQQLVMEEKLKPSAYRFMERHEPITALAICPNRRLLATVSDEKLINDSMQNDSLVQLWDVETMVELGELHGHTGPINGIEFSKDGKQIASFGEDANIHIWDTATGRQASVLVGHLAEVLSVTFSEDNQRLFSIDSYGGMSEWDLQSETLERVNSTGRTCELATYSQNGKVLACASSGNIYFYDVSSGDDLHKVKYDYVINSISFSPDGRKFAVASEITTRFSPTIRNPTRLIEPVWIQIWELSKSGKYSSIFEISTHEIVKSMAFTTDGERLITAGDEGNVTIWHIGTEEELYTIFNTKHSTTDILVEEYASGNITKSRVLVSDIDGNVWISSPSAESLRNHNRKLAVEKYISREEEIEQSLVINNLEIESLLNKPMSTDQNIILKMFIQKDASQSKVVLDQSLILTDSLRGASPTVISPDGTLLAFDSRTLKQSSLHIIDASTGTELARVNVGEGYLLPLRFSSDNQNLYYQNPTSIWVEPSSSPIFVWDIQNGTQKYLNAIEPANEKSELLSGDEEGFAMVTEEKLTQLWSMKTGKELKSLDTSPIQIDQYKIFPKYTPEDYSFTNNHEQFLIHHVKDNYFLSPSAKVADKRMSLHDLSTRAPIIEFTEFEPIVIDGPGPLLANIGEQSVTILDASSGAIIKSFDEDKKDVLWFYDSGKWAVAAVAKDVPQPWPTGYDSPRYIKSKLINTQLERAPVLAFSADGTLLGWDSTVETKPGKSPKRITVWEFMKSPPRHMSLFGGDISNPVIHPNLNEFCYSRYNKETRQDSIYICNIKDRVERLIYTSSNKVTILRYAVNSVTFATDETIRVIDATTSKELSNTTLQLTKKGQRLEISPNGKKIATSFGNNEVHISDSNGESISVIDVTFGQNSINKFALSAEGRYLACTYYGNSKFNKPNEIVIWDTQSTSISNFQVIPTGGVPSSIVFSSDGLKFACFVQDERGTNKTAVHLYSKIMERDTNNASKDAVQLWDTNPDKLPIKFPPDVRLSFGTSSTALAIYNKYQVDFFSFDSTAGRYAIDHLATRRFPSFDIGYRTIYEPINDIAISSHRNEIAFVTGQGLVVRSLLAEEQVYYSEETYSQVKFSADETFLIAIGQSMIDVFVAGYPNEYRRLIGSSKNITISEVDFIDNKIVYSATDSIVRIWDFSKSAKIKIGESNSVSASEVPLAIWETKSSEQLQCLQVDGSANNSFSFNREGYWTTTNKKVVAKISHNGDKVSTSRSKFRDSQLTVFSADGEQTASCSSAGEIRIWNTVDSIDPIVISKRLSGNEIKMLKFSPDGKLIASWDKDEIKIFNTNSGRFKWSLPVNPKFEGDLVLKFSPDGAKLVIGYGSDLPGQPARDKCIKIWSSSSGKLLSTFIQNVNAINAFHFSQDGKFMISDGLGVPGLRGSQAEFCIWDMVKYKKLDTKRTNSLYYSSHQVMLSPDGTKFYLTKPLEHITVFGLNLNHTLEQEKAQYEILYSNLTPRVEEWFDENKGHARENIEQLFEQLVTESNAESIVLRNIVIKKMNEQLVVEDRLDDPE